MTSNDPKGQIHDLKITIKIKIYAQNTDRCLSHEVGSHAGLGWYKLLVHDGPVVLEPRCHGAVSNHVLNVALPLLAASHLLTALLACQSNKKTFGNNYEKMGEKLSITGCQHL